jgi:hypothetical protein
MSKGAVRGFLAAICATGCVACPLVIVWLGFTYGFDRSPSVTRRAYQTWPSVAVDLLLLTAALSTAGFIVAMWRWWWLAALVSLPLLCVTAVLAVTGGRWIDGTHF